VVTLLETTHALIHAKFTVTEKKFHLVSDPKEQRESPFKLHF